MVSPVDGFGEGVGYVGDAAEFGSVDFGDGHEVHLLVSDGEFGGDDLGEDDMVLNVEV